MLRRIVKIRLVDETLDRSEANVQIWSNNTADRLMFRRLCAALIHATMRGLLNSEAAAHTFISSYLLSPLVPIKDWTNLRIWYERGFLSWLVSEQIRPALKPRRCPSAHTVHTKVRVHTPWGFHETRFRKPAISKRINVAYFVSALPHLQLFDLSECLICLRPASKHETC